MTLRIALAALLLAAVSVPPPATARAKGCRGTLSGAVNGTFQCTARVFTQGDTVYFSIDPAGPLEGVPGYSPGSFELPGKVEARTWTLDDLGVGRASAAHKNGTLYSAQKTSSQRGEVKLTLRSAVPDPKAKGAWIVHGQYKARLPPAGAGKEGAVIVEVEF